jgi:hypothetical protein
LISGHERMPSINAMGGHMAAAMSIWRISFV